MEIPNSAPAYAVTAARAAEVVRTLGSRFPLRRDRRARRRETLFDTVDWRLHAADRLLGAVSLKGETHLALRAGDGERLLHLVVPRVPAFVSDLPHSPLREALAALVGVRRLLPVAGVDVEVDTFDVLDERQKTIARVRIQHGVTFAPDAPSRRRRLAAWLRVAPVKGYEDRLPRVAAVLEGDCGLARREPRELVRVMRALGRTIEVPEKFQPVLDAGAPAVREVRKILGLLLAVVRRNEDDVRNDLDAEALHDLRVAVRRTRAALGQIKGVFARELTDPLRAELSWLQGTTGPVRDLDVYLLNVPGYRESLPPELQPHLDPLLTFLVRHKQEEHTRLVAELNGERYHELLRAWDSLASGRATSTTPPLLDAERPIAEVARERIRAAWIKALERGGKLGPDSPPEDLHRLRIECKKLRYLLEFFSGLLPESATRHPVAALKQLQDCLGTFNDLTLQQARLHEFGRRLAEEGLDGEGALAAIDRLVANLRELARRERAQFDEHFARFASAKNRERFAALLSGGPEVET